MSMLHVVLMQPRSHVDAARVEDLWQALRGLAAVIPGIEDVSCGPNTSPEGLEQGFTLGFVVRFTDAAARDGYVPHPAHVAVIPLVQAVAERVLVFDLDQNGGSRAPAGR